MKEATLKYQVNNNLNIKDDDKKSYFGLIAQLEHNFIFDDDYLTPYLRGSYTKVSNKNDIDALNSFIANLGLTYNKSLNNNINAYANVAVESELAGNTKGKLNQNTNPSIKGTSGVIALGINYKNDNILLGLNAKTSFGKNQNTGASLDLAYRFQIYTYLNIIPKR